MKKVILFSIFLISACRKDKELPTEWPFLETMAVEKNGESFVFHGNIINQPDVIITETGFVWSIYSNPSYSSSNKITIPSVIQEGEITAEDTLNLIPGKLYYCKAYLVTDQLIIMGNQVSFQDK